MKETQEYFKELIESNPYQKKGVPNSYSQYNQGWQDALDLAIQVAERIREDAYDNGYSNGYYDADLN